MFGQDEPELAGRDISINDVDSAAVTAAGKIDLAFLLVDATEPDWSAERRLAGRLNATGNPFFIVATHADELPTPQQAAAALRAQFPSHPPELTARRGPARRRGDAGPAGRPAARTVPTLRLALAHRFPPLRRPVAEEPDPRRLRLPTPSSR